MLILTMGAPGTCKASLREYLVKDKGFQDFTPENQEKQSDFFFDSLGKYVAGLTSPSDIIMSRTFWEFVEVHIPAYYSVCIDPGLSIQEWDFIEDAYKRFEEDFPAPLGIIYLKTNYLNATSRTQMRNKSMISQTLYDAICENYKKMFEKLGSISFNEIEVEEDDRDFYEQVDFLVDSFRRDSIAGTIWSHKMFHSIEEG